VIAYRKKASGLTVGLAGADDLAAAEQSDS